MRIVSGFILREIVSQTIAVPSGESAQHLSGLVSMNDCGRFLFELLQSEQTEDSLVRALMESYDVDMATAQQDVTEFLELLRENNLLV